MKVTSLSGFPTSLRSTDGRTPNPDVLCNTRIKFGAFMDAIYSLDYDYIASGHYANVVHPSADQSNNASILELSKDMVRIKHTSFHTSLSSSSNDLFSTWMSLKLSDFMAFSETNVFPSKFFCSPLAAKFDLPNKDRKDSQGICFLGKIRFSDLMEGIILEAETGDFLGNRGFWFYTIGQRQGLRLPGGPCGSPPNHVGRSNARHGPSFITAAMKWCMVKMARKTLQLFTYLKMIKVLPIGQFAAFYEGQTCLVLV
ncbi:hypothetical protein F3Y22_tig00002793pilonHSYRG00130 [Hibiscus syriacus]|uniref:tRNA-specific 2-thiouridylase MnmA-like central domain-containing protein n=1 Tax=Hibiscus syriacus TaxID=106335 RepID=A0A6A3CR02_HIBSY|nr:hypothetical protein F3Y22_tig00002793pilonHSYRG00130 [Hibiscus syriacus]